MKKPFSIVIAEDHKILREGLKSILSCDPDLKVVDEAADGLEAIRSAQNHSPDLVLLDLFMPRMTGLDAIKEIKRVSPQTKIIVLTSYNSEEYILSTLQAGADGYVLKEDGSFELLTAIYRVLDGRQYLSPSISDTIFDRLTQGKKASAIRSGWETVSKRERQILKLVAEGYKNREIADLLCISLKTVANHRTNLMEKLGLHNVASLTALAAKKGLINQ
jgi:DNA-binding NarL/FixJ family response regulator